ncbi:FCD domain-containing protein [Conexibacter arvalis]|uniref:GntR family transcriptional repressor for pyruvate dehydrogenase complex n=1 Tax=Conexibacter arvalis TaxID=912552 RepID=A0A840IC66_9ACTN|nr:GntR family transcriptional repressor for pyruvate dehydrogenase complex [Conexibacter arvalis]
MTTRVPDSADLDLSRIPRHKLARTVAEQLLDQIRGKDLRPGTKLPSERELQRALGVGRSTVREAINGLSLMGVIEIRHGSGAFVAEPPARQGPEVLAAALAKGVTRELFEARRIVEVETTRLAAERRSDTELHELELLLAEHERLIAAGRLAVEPSVAFHLKLAESARNELLEGFVISFSDQLAERGPVLERIDGFQAWELEQHRAVLAPVRDRDSDLAAQRMREHLDAVIRYHEQVGLE